MSKNVTVAEIKRLNGNNIYMLLKKEANLSKQEIAAKLQLSLPTVTSNLNRFIELGLVEESGFSESVVGRKASTYSIVKNAKVAIGIDINKHHVSFVSVNLVGEVEHSLKARKHFAVKKDYMKYIGEKVTEIIKLGGYDDSQILGVGVGFPGLVKDGGRTIFYGKTIMDFSGLTIDWFEEYIKYPCVFIKDADAACIAEHWSRQTSEDFFYVSLGNYVGGSARIYNRPYTGEGIRSCEIGHITIIPNGLQCYCGQKGCTDPYCTAWQLSQITDGDLDLFFTRLKEGDEACKKKFDEYLYHLSLAINNVRMLFDCKVILGSHVGGYMDDYIDRLREMLAERNSFEANGQYLELCTWKKDAVAAGAAIFYIEMFSKKL